MTEWVRAWNEGGPYIDKRIVKLQTNRTTGFAKTRGSKVVVLGNTLGYVSE